MDGAWCGDFWNSFQRRLNDVKKAQKRRYIYIGIKISLLE